MGSRTQRCADRYPSCLMKWNKTPDTQEKCRNIFMLLPYLEHCWTSWNQQLLHNIIKSFVHLIHFFFIYSVVIFLCACVCVYVGQMKHFYVSELEAITMHWNNNNQLIN